MEGVGIAGTDQDGIGPILFNDIWERFVEPEVAVRRQDGRLACEEALHSFQVLLHRDREHEVRLNSEIRGVVKAVATRDIAAGETVTTDDFSGVSEYEPVAEEVGVPHVTAFGHRGGWTIVFNLAYLHPKRLEYLEAGRDFAEIARKALADKRLRPCLENAFAAAELLAKAELLSCEPTIDLVLSSRSHGGVATPYNLWGQLGNTDQRFVGLLNRLAALRLASRYLDRDLLLKDGEPQSLIGLLTAMETHVAGAANRHVSNEPLRPYSVITNRDIKAGQLVMKGDYTLKPPRRARTMVDNKSAKSAS